VTKALEEKMPRVNSSDSSVESSEARQNNINYNLNLARSRIGQRDEE